MAEYDPAYAVLMDFEGDGIVDDPHDRGGMTFSGITRKNHGDWSGWRKIDEMLDAGQPVTRADSMLAYLVKDFYRRSYWATMQLEPVASQHLVTQLLLFAVHSGQVRAIKALQRLVDVKADGIVGPVTLAAVNGFEDQRGLAHLYRADVLDHYARIVQNDTSQAKWLRGWVRRGMAA
ncbi:MAG: glycosyl hydrolase 108 family protein [Pseudomonadota bacterium]